jgi:hypothetical protein
MHRGARNDGRTIREGPLLNACNYSRTKHKRNETGLNSGVHSGYRLTPNSAMNTVRDADGTPPSELMSRPCRNADHTLVSSCHPNPTPALHFTLARKERPLLSYMTSYDVTLVNRTHLSTYHVICNNYGYDLWYLDFAMEVARHAFIYYITIYDL